MQQVEWVVPKVHSHSHNLRRACRMGVVGGTDGTFIVDYVRVMDRLVRAVGPGSVC